MEANIILIVKVVLTVGMLIGSLITAAVIYYEKPGRHISSPPSPAPEIDEADRLIAKMLYDASSASLYLDVTALETAAKLDAAADRSRKLNEALLQEAGEIHPDST